MQIEEAKGKFPAFSRRFYTLRGTMSQADFAAFLGISRPTVGFYENGDRLPDALVLKNICKKCHVTSDWLLGLSENKNGENAAIGKITGLSDKAIERLTTIKKCSSSAILTELINFLLDNDRFTNNLLPLLLNYVVQCRSELDGDNNLSIISNGDPYLSKIKMSIAVETAINSCMHDLLNELSDGFDNSDIAKIVSIIKDETLYKMDVAKRKEKLDRAFEKEWSDNNGEHNAQDK